MAYIYEDYHRNILSIYFSAGIGTVLVKAKPQLFNVDNVQPLSYILRASMTLLNQFKILVTSDIFQNIERFLNPYSQA